MNNFDLTITNLITGEVEVLKNFGRLMCSDLIASGHLYIYVEEYIKNNVPFKIDFTYEVKK